jgi:hypothetical protein
MAINIVYDSEPKVRVDKSYRGFYTKSYPKLPGREKVLWHADSLGVTNLSFPQADCTFAWDDFEFDERAAYEAVNVKIIVEGAA